MRNYRTRNRSQKHTCSEILEAFKSEKPKKKIFGNYRIEDNCLIYSAQSSEKIHRGYTLKFEEWKKQLGEQISRKDGKIVNYEGKTVLLEFLTEKTDTYGFSIQYKEKNLIARKIKGENGTYLFLGNSHVLDLIGRKISYGHESRNSGETEIQAEMRESFHMMDLNLFLDSDFSTFKLLEHIEGGEYTVIKKIETYGRKETVEKDVNVSSLLFQLDGKTYLSDLDKTEIKKGHINYFTIEVPGNIKTISKAYESLVPRVLRDLKDWKRSGNLFFQPTSSPEIPELSVDEKMEILALTSYQSDQVIEYILGRKKQKKQREKNLIRELLLNKVPQERVVFLGENMKYFGDTRYNIETCIKLNGKIYCRGKVKSMNRGTLNLDGWHTVHAIGKVEIKS